MQQTVSETELTIANLLDEKSALTVQLEEEKRKCEDLLFRFEEESVNKDDIQVRLLPTSVLHKHISSISGAINVKVFH